MADTSCFVLVLVWFKYSGTSSSIQMGNGSDVAKSKVKAKERFFVASQNSVFLYMRNV